MANSIVLTPMQVFCLDKESFEAKYSFYETLDPRTLVEFGLCQGSILTLFLTQKKKEKECFPTVLGNVKVTLSDLCKVLIYDSM